MERHGSGIEGSDPLDFNSEKLLIWILTRIHHTKKWLTCETCGARKQSVVGFISHLQCCQKSFEEFVMLKMACVICGRVMLPASLKVHMSAIHKNAPKVEKRITQNEIEVKTKMKRAAATKSVFLMQEFIKDEDAAEGNEKPTKHSTTMDTMEEDTSFLDVDSQIYGRGDNSGRLRGRPRGWSHGCKNSACQILQRKRDLEQSLSWAVT
jgi:DNA-directed RNA polymerase beta' subunit